MDADALIKLHRSGMLPKVVTAFSCVIPQAVYTEVVTHGKARLHQDADAIDGTISGAVTILSIPERKQPELGLGAGEIGILGLLAKRSDPVVVSDDRRFLSVLSAQGTPFLTPSHMLIVLFKRSIITKTEASKALERLRPLIRSAAYEDARKANGAWEVVL